MPQSTPSIEELQKALELALAHNAQLQQEVKLLREKVEILIKKLFGAKSEKLDVQQLQLLLAGLGEPPPKKRNGPWGQLRRPGG